MTITKLHRVLFLPKNIEVLVPDGYSLARAALDAGVFIKMSCGGGGACGECRVIIKDGEVDGGISEKITKIDVKNGYRLACKSFIIGDIRVDIDLGVDIDLPVFRLASRKTARICQINLGDFKENGFFIPPVEKLYVELDKPDSSNRMPDVTRLLDHLKLNYNETNLLVSLSAIRKIPDAIRMGDIGITVTLARPVRSHSKTEVLNVQPGNTTDRNLAIAMDVGTTTIYGQLVDLKTGNILNECCELNAQMVYGEDVISRIIFAEKKNGLDEINIVLLKTINSIINHIVNLGKIKVDLEDISTITIAGNTTMTQLLLKVNPAYIRTSPYIPASAIYPPVRAIELGISLGEHANALVYPVISSYVGGDIVAGVMGSGMYASEKVVLLMDIGTNAEIVIGNRDWLVCAACSAGPAFEGGGIKFGMRADIGAIEDFSIDPITSKPILFTIGNSKPKGICGSGLITIVATLFELGFIDNIGKFNKEKDSLRIRKNNDVYEYVLAFKNETQIANDIVITEIDIGNFIRAKGAIFSGCMSMLDEIGMSIQDVDEVILAGGFGSYVDLDKAMVIGLLPEIDHDKVTFVGNSSLMGAKMSSLTNRIRKDVASVVMRMTNFELSETSSYMENYVASLFLPHTNIDLFPKLKNKMEARKVLKFN